MSCASRSRMLTTGEDWKNSFLCQALILLLEEIMESSSFGRRTMIPLTLTVKSCGLEMLAWGGYQVDDQIIIAFVSLIDPARLVIHVCLKRSFGRYPWPLLVSRFSVPRVRGNWGYSHCLGRHCKKWKGWRHTPYARRMRLFVPDPCFVYWCPLYTNVPPMCLCAKVCSTWVEDCIGFAWIHFWLFNWVQLLQVRLANHKHYVQGVAWDPASKYLVTQGADRTCRIYTCTNHLEPDAAAKNSQGVTQKWYLEHTILKRRTQGKSICILWIDWVHPYDFMEDCSILWVSCLFQCKVIGTSSWNQLRFNLCVAFLKGRAALSQVNTCSTMIHFLAFFAA